MLAALAAIRSQLSRGMLTDGLIFDAVRIRFIEIGEAANALDEELLATEPEIPGAKWSESGTTLLIATSIPRTAS